jgi:hypothetical protein
MVMTGNYRNRAELRKKPRQPFHYAAKILIDGTTPPQNCTISDVSDTGARIVLDVNNELPDRFMLLLSHNGSPRRRCRVVWRNGASLGVEFSDY